MNDFWFGSQEKTTGNPMDNRHMLPLHKILAIGVCVFSLLFIQVSLNGQSTTASEPNPIPQTQTQLFSSSEPVRTILDPAPDSYGLAQKSTEKPLLAAGSKNFGIALFFLGCLAHEDS